MQISAFVDIDAIIVPSFAQNTRVLFSVPLSALPKSSENETTESVSHLLDASSACNLVPNLPSLAIARLDEGLVAQVYTHRVRIVEFVKDSEEQRPLKVRNRQLCSSLIKNCWDWRLRPGETFTTTAVGSELVFMGVTRSSRRIPSLLVLWHS